MLHTRVLLYWFNFQYLRSKVLMKYLMFIIVCRGGSRAQHADLQLGSSPRGLLYAVNILTAKERKCLKRLELAQIRRHHDACWTALLASVAWVLFWIEKDWLVQPEALDHSVTAPYFLLTFSREAKKKVQTVEIEDPSKKDWNFDVYRRNQLNRI